MSSEESRRHPRVQIHATVDYTAENLVLDNKVENVSMGGVCIRTTRPEPVGTPVEVTLNFLTAHEEAQVEGEVIWTQAAKECRMGIRFNPLSDEQKARFNRLIYHN
jgi:uncharacterized protein (TIGR02266 family)